MRAKPGRCRAIFAICFSIGIFLTCQTAWAAVVISGAPATSVDEEAQYLFIPEISGETGEPIFSIQADSVLPAWLNFNDNTGTLSGTPGNNDVGLISNIEIRVADANSIDALPAFDLRVNNVNDPPTIQGNPKTSAQQGGTYSFTPFVNDIDAGDQEILTFNIDPALPADSWLSFSSTNGVLKNKTDRPTNQDVGTYGPYTISVRDETATTSLSAFSIQVINVNDEPVLNLDPLPPKTVEQNDTYLYTFKATDIDDIHGEEPLTYSIINLPSWLTLDSATGELSNQPDRPTNDDVGIYSDITVEVRDEDQASDSYTFNIEVKNVNDPPSISGLPEENVTQDNQYTFVPFATDIDIGDEQSLEFSVDSTSHSYPDLWPEWLDFDAVTGKLSGTPGNEDVGTIEGIVINVTDTSGASADQPIGPFDLTVQDRNDPPTITFGTEGPQISVNQGEIYRTEPIAEDVDKNLDGSPKDTLVFSIKNQPAWTTFSTETGILKNMQTRPNNSDVGVYENVTISVTDGRVITQATPFNVEVINVNDPPTILGTPQTTVNQGQSYNFTPFAEDKDLNDTLTFTVNSASHPYPDQWPAWLNFDPQTGNLSGDPQNENVGVIEGIEVSVNDSAGASPLSPLPPFNLTVVNVNDEPEISGDPQRKVPVGGTFSFTPTVTDDDKKIEGALDSFDYLVSKLPEWLKWSTTGEILTISNRAGRPTADDVKPNPNDPQPYNFTITVVDGQGGSAIKAFEVEVVEAFDFQTGDLNGSETVDLADAILGLKLLSGITIDEYIWLQNDANQDDVIGMENVIYILKSLSK